MAKKEPRDTFKYVYKVGNKPVHHGITNDLGDRENQHQQHRGWSKGHIVKLGRKTTRNAALDWERRNGYQANG